MKDAIVVHLESAHQVRVAPDVHGGLSERQNVIPIPVAMMSSSEARMMWSGLWAGRVRVGDSKEGGETAWSQSRVGANGERTIQGVYSTIGQSVSTRLPRLCPPTR